MKKFKVAITGLSISVVKKKAGSPANPQSFCIRNFALQKTGS